MRKESKAAYYFVDLSGLPEETKAEILEDVAAGGGEYGVRVVEEVVNGPASAPIYGVYYGEDHEKWQKAKETLDIAVDTKASDADAIAAAAKAQADADADAVRAAEQAQLDAIDKGGDGTTNKANKAK